MSIHDSETPNPDDFESRAAETSRVELPPAHPTRSIPVDVPLPRQSLAIRHNKCHTSVPSSEDHLQHQAASPNQKNDHDLTHLQTSPWLVCRKTFPELTGEFKTKLPEHAPENRENRPHDRVIEESSRH